MAQYHLLREMLILNLFQAPWAWSSNILFHCFGEYSDADEVFFRRRNFCINKSSSSSSSSSGKNNRSIDKPLIYNPAIARCLRTLTELTRTHHHIKTDHSLLYLSKLSKDYLHLNLTTTASHPLPIRLTTPIPISRWYLRLLRIMDLVPHLRFLTAGRPRFRDLHRLLLPDARTLRTLLSSRCSRLWIRTGQVSCRKKSWEPLWSMGTGRVSILIRWKWWSDCLMSIRAVPLALTSSGRLTWDTFSKLIPSFNSFYLPTH